MRMSAKCRTSLALLLAAAMAQTVAQAADLTNGGFETGDLSGWFSSGTTAMATGAAGYAPQAGGFSALVVAMSQAPVPPYSCESDIWNLACPQPLSFASSGAALPTYGVNLEFIRGAFIGQDITVGAGDQISWTWAPYGEAAGGILSVDEGRFFATNGTLSQTVDYDSGASSFTFSETGLWSVYFGLYQTQDPYGWSAMRFDAISITAVPEPASAALVLLGLCGLGMVKSRFSAEAKKA